VGALNKGGMVMTLKRISLLAAGMLVSSSILNAASAIPSLDEHSDLLQTIIAALIFVLMFFSQRTLARIERNQGILFEMVEKIKTQVDTLQGEHNMLKSWHERARRSTDEER
jgi:hypothetical protein